MTASEADAGEALWRRLTVPEKERRKLLDNYRDAILHTGAEKIRSTYGQPRWLDHEPEYAYGVNHATHDAADLIDPDMQEQA